MEFPDWGWLILMLVYGEGRYWQGWRTALKKARRNDGDPRG